MTKCNHTFSKLSIKTVFATTDFELWIIPWEKMEKLHQSQHTIEIFTSKEFMQLRRN